MVTKLPGRVTIAEDQVFGATGAKHDARELKCDVFTPPDERTDRPAVLLIHGGAWQQGDKTQLRGYGIQLARYGFLCVCSEYRLSGESQWPAQIHDVKAAVRWMRANHETLGLDPARIAAAGNSAGAHLALMIGATPNVSVFEGDGGNPGVDSSCSAIAAVYPPTRLQIGKSLDTPIAKLFGGKSNPHGAEAASPITYVHREFPPTMLIHGNADTTVPVSESLAMYQALSEAHAPVEMHIYDGAPHAFDAVPEHGRQVIDLMALFLDRKMANPRGFEALLEQRR